MDTIAGHICAGAYMLHAVSIDSIVAQHSGRQLGWGWTQLRLCPPLTLNFQSIVSIIHSIALVDAIAHKSSSHTLTWYLPISWPRASACTLLCSTMPTLLYSTLHTLHTRVFLKCAHCCTTHCTQCKLLYSTLLWVLSLEHSSHASVTFYCSVLTQHIWGLLWSGVTLQCSHMDRVSCILT